MGRRVLILAAGISAGHNIAPSVLESCFRAASEVDVVQKRDIPHFLPKRAGWGPEGVRDRVVAGRGGTAP